MGIPKAQMERLFGQPNDATDIKAKELFPGRVVKKGLTSLIRTAESVPTYVLEYFLAQYCSDDSSQELIEAGYAKIDMILRERYVRREQAELFTAKIRERGDDSFKVIDKISARLNTRHNVYVGECANLGISLIIPDEYVMQYSRMLTSGIWCIIAVSYTFPAKNPLNTPFTIMNIKPIQAADFDSDEIREMRSHFTFIEWRDLILRSVGYEPAAFTEREKLHFIARMIPLVEHNFNCCELGPRGTGKSYMHTEVSPYSILISGGQASAATIFYNKSTRKTGLLGHWDVVAFDEIAGIDFHDTYSIHMLKDYMESGSFARSETRFSAGASIAFVGNIDDWETNEKAGTLFSPFPDDFNEDAAFFDRIHLYLPGWEIPTMKPEYITSHYGFVTDCIAEFFKQQRGRDYSGLFEQYFTLNSNVCSTRDVRAIKRTFSGLCKILFPDERISKEYARLLLEYAIEGRRRVKEQLRTMIPKEFSAVDLGYIDNSDKSRVTVFIPKYSKRTVVPNVELPYGHVFAAGKDIKKQHIGIYRLENEISNNDNCEFNLLDVNLPQSAQDCVMNAFSRYINDSKAMNECDMLQQSFSLCCDDMQNIGASDELGVAEYIGLISAAQRTPVMRSLVVIGDICESGALTPTDDILDMVAACKAAGARAVLLPVNAIQKIDLSDSALNEGIKVYAYDSLEAAVRIALCHDRAEG